MFDKLRRHSEERSVITPWIIDCPDGEQLLFTEAAHDKPAYYFSNPTFGELLGISLPEPTASSPEPTVITLSPDDYYVHPPALPPARTEAID